MSTTGMYRVKPVFKLTGEFKHTSSMYNLKPVNMNPCISQLTLNSIPSNSDRSARENEIISRQEKLINDLNAMQEQFKIIRDKIDTQKLNKTDPKFSQSVAESTDILAKFRTLGVQDIVINADPNHPPYALLWLTKLWNLPVDISVHLHSSVSALPEKLSSFTSLTNVTSSESSIKVTFVWKEVGPDAQLVVSPIKNKVILGEVNILRFFETFMPENDNLDVKIKNNEVLDIAHRLNHVSGKEVYVFVSKLSNILGTNHYFTQKSDPSVVDVAVWSVLLRKTKLNALPSNLKKWASSYSENLGKDLNADKEDVKFDIHDPSYTFFKVVSSFLDVPSSNPSATHSFAIPTDNDEAKPFTSSSESFSEPKDSEEERPELQKLLQLQK
ncbi:hypothetical protein V9T40_001142 [Parthenolecanium corni]|uniref:AIMP2 thioredoxin-like domain-containing protein n=1 Tax=Parthenolecanium corni TaxID=536013 RepID=A0AAN9Y2E4_9HEMI